MTDADHYLRILFNPDRTVSAFWTSDGTERPLPHNGTDGTWEGRPFHHIPEAANFALHDLALALNVTKADGQADLRAALAMVRQRAVGLFVEGTEREVNVAALYLWLEFGLAPVSEGGRVQVRALSTDRRSIYETFGADDFIRPLVNLAEDRDRVRAVLEKNGFDSDSLDRSLAQHSWHRIMQERRITLGITGKTGVGKSMFVNALLRRALLPSSTEITTAVVCWLEHAGGAAEYFTVQVLDEADHQAVLDKAWTAAAKLTSLRQKVGMGPSSAADLARQLDRSFWKSRFGPAPVDVNTRQRGASSGHALDNERLAAIECLEELEKAYAWLEKHKDKRLSLALLSHATQARRPTEETQDSRPNMLPSLIESVRIYVNAPILEHIRIVDTPGMADDDDIRDRAFQRVAEHLDCWFLLVRAKERSNQWKDILGQVQSDLADLKERAESRVGAIVMTQVDELVADATRGVSADIDSLTRTRRERYSALLSTVTTCSAMSAMLVEAHRITEDTLYDWEDHSSGWKLRRGRIPRQRLLRRADDEALKTVQRSSLWGQALADLQLELSEFLPALRTLLDLLQEQTIDELLKLGQSTLSELVEEHHTRLTGQLKVVQEQVDADDLARSLSKGAKRLKRKKKYISDSLETQREFLGRALDEIRSHHQRRLKAFDEACSQYKKDSVSAARQSIKTQYKEWKVKFWWGSFTLDLPKWFSRPAEAAARQALNDGAAACYNRSARGIQWIPAARLKAEIRKTSKKTSFGTEGPDTAPPKKRSLGWDLNEAMKEAASAARCFATDVGGKMKKKLKDRLDKIAEGVESAGQSELEKLKRDLQVVSDDLKEIIRQIEEAQSDVEAPRREILRRRRNLKRHIEALEAFQADFS